MLIVWGASISGASSNASTIPQSLGGVRCDAPNVTQEATVWKELVFRTVPRSPQLSPPPHSTHTPAVLSSRLQF